MIVLLGGSGFLGSRIQNYLQTKNIAFVTIGRSNENNFIADFHNQTAFMKTLFSLNPSVVINCIAATDIENCEINSEYAYEANVYIPELLANCQNYQNFKIIHISTDHFYDKIRSSEEETVILNEYANTKLLGELALSNENVLIFRTNFFGLDEANRGRGLIEKVIKTVNKGHVFEAFTDVLFNPLFVDDLIKLIILSTEKFNSGIFNIGSSSYCSKAKFVAMCFEKLDLDMNLYEPISSENIKNRVKRPRKMVSKLDKASSQLGFSLPSLEDTFARFIKRDKAILSKRKKLDEF